MKTLGFVASKELLEQLFPDPILRPTLRTLANWRKARLIPYHRLGGRIYYEIEPVVEAIKTRTLIRPGVGRPKRTGRTTKAG